MFTRTCKISRGREIGLPSLSVRFRNFSVEQFANARRFK